MIKSILLTLIVAYVAVAAYLFVVHHDDRPAKADAVVVLSGAKQRLPVGERLVQQGYAPLLVVSRSTHPKAAERRACRSGALCFRAQPFSTRGEARAIARLAAAHHWRMIDVVTSQFHVFRARIVIRRCYHGGLRMVGAPESRLHLPIDIAKETAKLVYQEVVARGC
ncbi:MAG TPA: ElyC/SanA/YdcF family protein [Gaiellaceae bacterium]